MDISPTQSDVQTAVGKFLQAVLPANIDIVVGLGNRVPEPAAPNFVVMTPIRFSRLGTNFDTLADVKFVGSVADTTMSVTEVDFGTIEIGSTLFGIDVAGDTKITAQTSGAPGSVGTYSVSVSQTIAPRVLASGAIMLTIAAEATVQLDFHTADTTAADLAQTVSTTFRDEFATRFFGSLTTPLNRISPFHADDPRLMPFVNDQQQYEWRWIVEAKMQVDQKVAVPQQFADHVTVGLIEIDEHFPP